MPFWFDTRRGTASIVVAVCLLVVVSACQSAAPASAPAFPTALTQPTLGGPLARPSLAPVTGTPGKTLNLQGNFAYVGNDGNLTLQNANTGETRVLVPTGATGYAQFPAFSPDGKQIAYAYNTFTKEGYVQTQLRVIGVDGANDRIVVAPQDVKTTLAYPAWSADGKNLYVTQVVPVQPSGQRGEIDRVPASGGDLVKVIDNAGEGALSPDGKSIVYLQIDFGTGTSSLWVANIDGSNPKQLVDSGTFLAMIGARFSPDSHSVVFAASGPPKKKLAGYQSLLVPPPDAGPCLVGIGSLCVLDRAEANGLPWDLWMANVDGSKFDRLTNIGADSPVPAWSRDGKYVSFFDTTGLYLVDTGTKAVYLVSNLGGHGSFDWR